MSDRPAHAWKVLTRPQLDQLLGDGLFNGAPVDLADGYIHMSTDDQLQGTFDKHFAGQDDLVLARIDLTALRDPVRWEVSRGGALFPHLYGPLPLSAVSAHGPVERRADGTIILPV
ncbi:MAG: DUF952 domain-containing protein [Novosphingobium sp.]|nr:DUF952 domain-containing protein [Novosphingobium sp.]